MSQQIGKKFIKNDSIDGAKIKLTEGQAIRGTDSLGQEVDLLKLNEQDQVTILGEEIVVKGNAPEHLDTLEEIAQAIENIDTSTSFTFETDIKFTVDGSTVLTSHIDLSHQAISILHVKVGFISPVKNKDFTVSVVNGKTRITWVNDMAGELGMKIGSEVFVTYIH